jgi:NifU-like protein
MWDYTDKVKDHFFNPRNVGTIENPDGVGEVGSLACGDALTFMFKLDEGRERIADAKFKTFGCASAIASSSALTEMVIGKSIDEAGRITNQDIADFLGGLPDQKMHCSVMGREALDAAIENFRTGKVTTKAINEDIVCNCFGVTRQTIEQVVRDNDLKTAEDVTNYVKAGGGCGNCIEDIEAIIADVQKHTGHDHDHGHAAPKKKKLSNLQRMKLVEETIEKDIRPMLQNDGGDIELVDIDGLEVTVSLRGHCATCPASQATLHQLVEKKLSEALEENIIVKEAEE